MLSWAVGVLPFCCVGGGSKAPAALDPLGNGSGPKCGVVLCLECLLCPSRSIYSLFIVYEKNILVQELECTSIFRAGIYSRIPD